MRFGRNGLPIENVVKTEDSTMAARREGNAWVWLVISLVVLLLLALFVGPFLLPWARLNCHIMEMDITSGRERDTQYLLLIPFSSQRETVGSRLYRELVGEPGEPIWKTVNYTTPAIRTHPVHHGSSFALEKLVDAVDRPGVTREAKREAIVTIFRLLQEADGDFPAKEYSRAVAEVTYEWKPGDAPIGPEMLPPPPKLE